MPDPFKAHGFIIWLLAWAIGLPLAFGWMFDAPTVTSAVFVGDTKYSAQCQACKLILNQKHTEEIFYAGR